MRGRSRGLLDSDGSRQVVLYIHRYVERSVGKETLTSLGPLDHRYTSGGKYRIEVEELDLLRSLHAVKVHVKQPQVPRVLVYE